MLNILHLLNTYTLTLMNKVSFLSCLVLLITINTKAQKSAETKPNEPPKKGSEQTAEPVKNKSNRIILHFKDTSGLFTKLAKTLIDIGYEFEEKDRELGILKTKPTDQPGGWTFKNEIKAVFRDSVIILSDVMNSMGLKIDLCYVTKKGIIHYKAWSHLMEVANGLKPEHITYMEVK